MDCIVRSHFFGLMARLLWPFRPPDRLPATNGNFRIYGTKLLRKATKLANDANAR